MSESKGDDGGSFDERLRTAQRRQGLGAPPSSPGAPGQGGAQGLSPFRVALSVGVEMVSALVVGVAIGWWLDRWLHTAPILLAVFVLLGGAAGVANVWRRVGPRGGSPAAPAGRD
jgi:ATP synthase protein I